MISRFPAEFTCYVIIMFGSKEEKKPLGGSFPFIENENGDFSMKYDSMNFKQKNGQFTLTFIQDGVPIYAHTIDALDEYSLDFTGMEGVVRFDRVICT